MAVVNAINGQAPAGLKIGDTVNTNGGLYTIVRPGTPGSNYNPASGYSSIKVSDLNEASLLAYNQQEAERNTARSEAQARTQMRFQEQSNAKAMQFSAEQARINREFQERLSNTAHQREVKDLIAAGLNPVLSTTFAGATTPSGASASGIASSGSKADVDTSTSQIVNGLLSALTAQATALETTAMSNLTALKSSSIMANAQIGSAKISGENMIKLEKIKQEFQEWIYKNYPQTDAGIVSKYTERFVEMLKNMYTDAKNNASQGKKW